MFRGVDASEVFGCGSCLWQYQDQSARIWGVRPSSSTVDPSLLPSRELPWPTCSETLILVRALEKFLEWGNVMCDPDIAEPSQNIHI